MFRVPVQKLKKQSKRTLPILENICIILAKCQNCLEIVDIFNWIDCLCNLFLILFMTKYHILIIAMHYVIIECELRSFVERLHSSGTNNKLLLFILFLIGYWMCY